MLAGSGKSTTYIYNALAEDFKIERVLLTTATSKIKMLKRRVKKLGYFHVFNQLLFQFIVVKVLKYFNKKSYKDKETLLKLNSKEIPINVIETVGNVNSKTAIKTLKTLEPDVVIVNGTAIISKKVLACTDAIFINTHVGITPEYRGVHGGYWALRNNDKENFGVTVHLVDKGIDTGSIIYQATTKVKEEDNFITYPLYQYALAIPLLKKTLKAIEKNEMKPYKKENSDSKLYYHPTLTKYIVGWLFKGVK